MVTHINGSTQTVDLGSGFALRAPGRRGTAELLQPGAATTRAPALKHDAGLVALDHALSTNNISEIKLIELSLQPAAGPPAFAPPAPGRFAATAGEIELDVPDLGADVGQILLSIDDAGVVRWHLPLTDRGPAPGASRSLRNVRRFRVPAPVWPQPVSGSSQMQPQARSLFGLTGRVLLKALVYPITDPLLGAISDEFAARWEQVRRPYRVRRFTVDNYRSPDAAPLDADELASLCAGGPVLLFVHGTFSTAHSAFGGLAAGTLDELVRRYDSRVIAFDHPTLSASPLDNARWLLARMPRVKTQMDVVSHSRGGLVARLLAEQPTGAGLDAPTLQVRRVVFAGVPNGGTLLADPDHMVTMADRFTSALTLAPTGPITETFEALITLIKMLAHGALKGLGGLTSMHPGGSFLAMLNQPRSTRADYFAVTSNYQPADQGLRRLALRLVDGAADEIFDNAANDLIVPTEGVWQRNGGGAFPLLPERVLTLDPSQGVMHTGFFPHDAVARHMLSWLETAAAG
jgi:hypothetical protein